MGYILKLTIREGGFTSKAELRSNETLHDGPEVIVASLMTDNNLHIYK